jgi:hypothetical protein
MAGSRRVEACSDSSLLGQLKQLQAVGLRAKSVTLASVAAVRDTLKLFPNMLHVAEAIGQMSRRVQPTFGPQPIPQQQQQQQQQVGQGLQQKVFYTFEVPWSRGASCSKRIVGP